jgi:hypothetical protein
LINTLDLVITLPVGDDGLPVPKVRASMTVTMVTQNPWKDEALVIEGHCEEVRKLRAAHGEIVVKVAPGGIYSSFKVVGHGAWLCVAAFEHAFNPDAPEPQVSHSPQRFAEMYIANRGNGLLEGARAPTLNWNDTDLVKTIPIGELGAGMVVAKSGLTLNPEKLALQVGQAPWTAVQDDRRRVISTILEAVGYQEVA